MDVLKILHCNVHIIWVHGSDWLIDTCVVKDLLNCRYCIRLRWIKLSGKISWGLRKRVPASKIFPDYHIFGISSL
jgi:hypothetical protein